MYCTIFTYCIKLFIIYWVLYLSLLGVFLDYITMYVDMDIYISMYIYYKYNIEPYKINIYEN